MGCVRDRGSKAFLLIGREKRKRTTKDVDRMSPEGEIQPNSPTAQSPEEFEYGLEMKETPIESAWWSTWMWMWMWTRNNNFGRFRRCVVDTHSDTPPPPIYFTCAQSTW